MTRYPALVTDESVPEPWIAVRAKWVMDRVESHGLVFMPGDTLIEYFSPEHWFDVFRVQNDEGEVRGWYANVTYPVAIDEDEQPQLTWHDLYLDVIKKADGDVTLCDEDELDESGLVDSDPLLHQLIIETAADLVRLAESSIFPFHPGTGT